MSELFMECEEEELEPWQKQVPEVNLLDDDDDDEPIFVGELMNTQRNSKPNPTPLKKNDARPQGVQSLASQPTRGPVPIMLPSNMLGKGANSATPTLTTITPQPVIINNQGFIVTQPQLTNTELIASLGKQYPPGTSFTIVQAGQQHILQQIAPAKVLPGVVHRPQVQQINNNIVTLSNVQSPAIFSSTSNQLQFNQTNLQPVQLFSVPVTDQSSLKRRLVPQQHDELLLKKTKVDLEPPKVNDTVENGLFRKNCSNCNVEFLQQEDMKSHMMNCCANLVESGSQSVPNTDSPTAIKRIMLLSDFYYGRFDGEQQNSQMTKSTSTFKCKSCLKVLKNNIRFMNHMKHHLELEKQNSESWDSHTTCQHCYRQYLTPFQLQCHIENAHSTSESATNCKICELAFESEQVLLEHMKDNHKPGEMPYVCQVCNFRSSFFNDVDAHFRSVHENTKDLLCPFCLRVLRSGHMYMQHYMKHQKKGIHRCGKCRLNFLTNKERIDHKINFHKTFRKPPALEGLPPGSKVTIRASRTGKMPLPLPNQTGVIAEMSTSRQIAKAQCNIPKSKLHISTWGQDKSAKKERRISLTNLVLQKLRIDGGHYTCIECDTKIDDFFSHYPMTSSCGACNYRTSCKVSIGNHMIRFHSSITKGRFWRMANRKKSSPLNFTLVCLNCDLLVDATKSDLMTKHLAERPRHVCRFIQDKDIHVEDLGVLTFGDPSKDLDAIALAPTERPKEVDMKKAESVEPGAPLVEGNSIAPEKEEISAQRSPPPPDQDMGATETTSIERSPEKAFDESSQRSPPPPDPVTGATETTSIERSPEKAFDESSQRSPPPPDQDMGATETTSIERSPEKAFDESSQRSPPPPDQDMGATEISPEKAFEKLSQPSSSTSLVCTLDQDTLDVSLGDSVSAGVREKAPVEPLISSASD